MTEQSQPHTSVSRCTACNTPLVDDQPLADARRFFMPYHECVSWTYINGERVDEALLRIRKALKTAAGWWSDQDEREYEAFMAERIAR